MNILKKYFSDIDDITFALGLGGVALATTISTHLGFEAGKRSITEKPSLKIENVEADTTKSVSWSTCQPD